MSTFPHDEFDDVAPYQQGEAGKHRAPAAPAGAARGGGLKWIGLLAVLALVVGVVSYFVLPTFTDDTPEAGDDAEVEESEGEDEGNGDGEDEENGEDGENGGIEFSGTAADVDAPVQILNHEGPSGLEDEVSAQLEEMEYNVTFIDEWTYGDVETPTIYHPSGAQDHAEDLAENLGVDNVVEDDNWSFVALVVGPEFAE